MNWLFLRGLARESRHWRSFPRVFERTISGAKTHLLDLPGAGTEHLRTCPTSIEGIVADMRARWLPMRAANPGRWGLLGMSLGGMIAMAWCDIHPEDFAEVVLVSTSVSDLSAPWKRFGLGIVPTAIRALRERDPVERERRILSMTTSLTKDVDAVAREWAQFSSDRPMRRSNVLRQLVAARAYRSPSRMKIPVLVIAGARDRMADPSCSRLLASQFAAPLEVHPEGGHELALDAPEWLAERVGSWTKRAPATTKDGVKTAPYGNSTLPWVVSPEALSKGGLGSLLDYVKSHHETIERELLARGAVLFRGFEVGDAAAFEKVAKAIGPTLGNQYLGTSPRNALTEFTFSASELPPHYPIAQHCEMSFVKKPPQRIFFACLKPSTGAGGETPLADFRAVWRDLEPSVRAKFEQRGVRSVRNYAGPKGGGRFDLWKLKRWDEMFHTTDRDEVERVAIENGFDVSWWGDGMLRLVNVQPAWKPHPVNAVPAWFNHSQVFHLSSVPDEYRRIAERQGQLRYQTLSRIAGAMVKAKTRTTPLDDQAMHCTYGDGSPITDHEMDLVRDAIWKNMVFFKWRTGDVLVIDNNSVSHGRMPYQGPRSVAVAWSLGMSHFETMTLGAASSRGVR